MSTTTIPQDKASDAAYIDAIMRQARVATVDRGIVAVIWWDVTSDPADPGWVRRTYSLVDGQVTSVDEIL